MAQVFHPGANVLARASLVAFILLPVGLVGAGMGLTRSSYNTKVGVPLDQPVPFSHEHHVNQLGIDCRYCHTSVEKSAFAGVPPTHTCMSCHSQIWTNSPLLEPLRESYRTGIPLKWNRVNKLPDFVYFNHSVHIKKGIGCDQCHGKINHMNLTSKANTFFMSWCLTCHRDPEKFIRPRDRVFNLDYEHPANQDELGKHLVEKYHVRKDQLTDCWVCHH